MVFSVFLGSAAASRRNPVASTIFALVYLVIWILAIVLSLQCNKPGSANRFWPILGAVLFPEIYLIQFAVRKYLIKESGYCPAVRGMRF